MTLVLVGLGGLAGALARHGLTQLASPLWVVAAINVAGSFALGLLLTAGAGLAPELRTGLATGLLGGLTTFSTFSVQAVAEVEAGRAGTAVLYVLVSVGGGIAAAAAGWAFGRAIA